MSEKLEQMEHAAEDKVKAAAEKVEHAVKDLEADVKEAAHISGGTHFKPTS